MPRKILRRIVAVAAVAPQKLRIDWDNSAQTHVDVSDLIETFRAYAPLRDPELFRQVGVGEHGTDIVWSDDLDMGADTLWRLAQEQTGAS